MSFDNFIGIIPAAGKAERLNGIPKYLLPVGDDHLLHFHLDQHRRAGVHQAVVATSQVFEPVVRKCSWEDTLVYTVQTGTQNETVLTARRYYGQCHALMTMPDTWYEDLTISKRLTDVLDQDRAIVAVALWHIRDDQQGKLGQCLSRDGEVLDVIDKDPDCPYLYAWGAMAWSPSFWGFIDPAEPHPGYALARAVKAGVRPQAVFAEGNYYDLGTFKEYQKLCLDLQGAVA